MSVLVLPLVLALAEPAPAAAPAPATPPATEPTPAAPADVAPITPPAAPVAAPELAAPVAPPEPAPPVAPAPAPKKSTPARTQGPFFVGEPASDTAFPNGPRRGDPPRFSVGRGAFCFVDDTFCRSSLILTADVGIGTNIAGAHVDLPYAHFNFRGGFALKPLLVGHKDGWHPWGLGLLGSWSRGTGAPTGKFDATPHTDTWRVLLVNQLWLSKKRNGLHLDVDVGLVRSTVFNQRGQFYGSHAGLSANWGGWGGLFMAADFLDHDTRVVFGFRANALAAAPAIGLVLLGLLAGGAFGGAS